MDNKGFIVVDNGILEDPRLGVEALGVYLIMKSLGEESEHTITSLCAHTRMGRDAIRHRLKELETAGYIAKKQPGHGKAVYVLAETAPEPGEPAEQ